MSLTLRRLPHIPLQSPPSALLCSYSIYQATWTCFYNQCWFVGIWVRSSFFQWSVLLQVAVVCLFLFWAVVYWMDKYRQAGLVLLIIKTYGLYFRVLGLYKCTNRPGLYTYRLKRLLRCFTWQLYRLVFPIVLHESFSCSILSRTFLGMASPCGPKQLLYHWIDLQSWLEFLFYH